MGLDVDLGGRNALVTGASGGLGAHFARLLARHGAAVALAARRVDRLEGLAAEIAAAGGRAHAVAMDVADEAGVDILFEAAAVAAVPVVRTLRESLRAEEIQRLVGIINGTTNYILSAMSARGLEYAVALKEAQDLGYAEPNPYADVSGKDAGSKLAILASLAFGMDLAATDVGTEGIDLVADPT